MLGWNHLASAAAVGLASRATASAATSGAFGERVASWSSAAFSAIAWPVDASAALWWALFLLGTLAPDIDNRRSLIRSRIVRPLLRLLHIKRRRRLEIERGPNDIRGHRTWTHTIWVVAGLGLAGWFFWRPLLAFAAGYFLHLVLDSMSVCGVAWAWPLVIYDGRSESEKWVQGRRGGLYRAGGVAEYALVAAIVLLAALAIVGIALLEGAGAETWGAESLRVLASGVG